MIVNDRADGVTGPSGAVEGIDGMATARDTARGTQATVRTTIAPDDRTAPDLRRAPGRAGRAGARRHRPGTMTLHMSISSPALAKPIVYRNVYAAAGDVVSLASGQLPRMVAMLVQNALRRSRSRRSR